MVPSLQHALFGLVLLCRVLNGAAIKECTNMHTHFPKSLARHHHDHHHDHLTPTDESTWMDLKSSGGSDRPSPFDWLMLYRTLKGSGDPAPVAGLLSEVSLHDVRLEPDSIYGRAQQTNLEYLLLLDVDNLTWSFRKQAGLPTPGKPYGGWEGPDVELRGHFVGHYMSATALMWASTHNLTIKAKMSKLVDILYECQRKIGTGYLSAFPTELFDRFEALQYVWAPYYTIHKIMQGLLDQYKIAGNSKALSIVVWMADYFGNRVKNVIQKYSLERHWTSLNDETGGMNDVLYQLYRITNNQRHLILAHLFDKPCFLGLLAVRADSLSGFHANTHIPVVIGAQMRYEVTGDPIYKEIATFFLDTVNSSHTYATGGTSYKEFWQDPKRLAHTLQNENEESCTTYNMLKVSRNLFRWTRDIAYANYYERALINGVLSIQRGTEPGVMIYMLPLGAGRSKAVSLHKWGTQFDSFWCCYGTGIESFSKLGDSIYFVEEGDAPALYVVQYIPSTYNWKAAGLTVKQQTKPLTSSDSYVEIALSFSGQPNGQHARVNVRIPSWTSVDGARAALNGRDLELTSAGTFLLVTKEWSSNDSLLLQFPITIRTEALEDDRPEYASVKAVLFGPYLLAGLTTGDWDLKSSEAKAISDWITPVPLSHNSQLVTLTQESGGKTFVFSSLNSSLGMRERPNIAGTNASVAATFRVYSLNSKSPRVAADGRLSGMNLMIEPFDFPGMMVTNNLTISGQKGPGSLFNIVPGLDGKPNSVSLELGTKPGCFLVTGTNYSAGQTVQVGCQKHGDPAFVQAASFAQTEPLMQYHPMSFVATGVRRNFLLEPLFALRDEFYTVYFNLGA